jgi:hypothetical protein
MDSPEASGVAPRLLVTVLVVGLLVGVFVVLVWPASDAGVGGTSRDPTSVADRRAGSRVEAEAAAVLRAWDRRRARAWATSDTSALRSLYVPGASAGRADVAMLRAWTSRGLAVGDLTTQLLAVGVVAQGPRRWVLRVRDRVTGAVAAGGATSRSLPAGSVAERTVTLRRWGGDWRVASVRPATWSGPARR